MLAAGVDIEEREGPGDSESQGLSPLQVVHTKDTRLSLWSSLSTGRFTVSALRAEGFRSWLQAPGGASFWRPFGGGRVLHELLWMGATTFRSIRQSRGDSWYPPCQGPKLGLPTSGPWSLHSESWSEEPSPQILLCSGSEAGSYLRLIDSCITQLKAQGPFRTCNESKEEEEILLIPPAAGQATRER